MGLHEVALHRFSFATIIITTIAFLALTIGVFSPAWSVVERNGVRISEGPWYTRACPQSGGDCILSSMEAIYGMHSDGRGDSVLRKDHWLAIQIECTCAVALSCLGLMVAIVAFVKRNWASVHWLLVVGGTSIFTSAILSLIAVLKLMLTKGHINMSAPWSRDLTFVGSLAAFGASFLYVFSITQSCVRYIKLKRLKRISTSSFRNSTSQQGPNIQVIILNNFPSGSSPQNGSAIPPKYETHPPAYSDICGENVTS